MSSKSDETILNLAKKHADEWHSSAPSLRISYAKQILAQMKANEWSTYLSEENKLLGRDENDHNEASLNRYIFGSLVQTFLTGFIEGQTEELRAKDALVTKVRDSKDTPGNTVKIHGPKSFGAGIVGELYAYPDGFKGLNKGCDAVEAYDEKAKRGKATVVLGAGNQSFLGMIDILDRVLIHGETVLFKHHPLRPYLLAPFSIILKPLVDAGIFAQILDTSIPDTVHIIKYASVGHVHFTGAERTNRALLKCVKDAGKEGWCGITSELGCATPWLIVPGTWTKTELKTGAKALVTAKRYNGGANCLCAQSVIVPFEWSQKDEFLGLVREELKSQKCMPVYYTGALEKRKEMVGVYGDKAEIFQSKEYVGRADSEHDAVLVDCGVYGESDYNGVMCSTEAFSVVLAIVTLKGLTGTDTESIHKYVTEILVPFANSENVCGSLSCTVLTSKTANTDTVEIALADLNFGSVCLNIWSIFGYVIMANGMTWGAHATDNVVSGRGRVGNTYGIKNVLKSVVRNVDGLEGGKIDLSSTLPSIVCDVLHVAGCATSNWNAVPNVVSMLVVRGFQAILGGKEKRYQAAV